MCGKKITRYTIKLFKVWGDYIWCHWAASGEGKDAAQPPSVIWEERNPHTPYPVSHFCSPSFNVCVSRAPEPLCFSSWKHLLQHLPHKCVSPGHKSPDTEWRRRGLHMWRRSLWGDERRWGIRPMGVKGPTLSFIRGHVEEEPKERRMELNGSHHLLWRGLEARATDWGRGSNVTSSWVALLWHSVLEPHKQSFLLWTEGPGKTTEAGFLF